MDEMAYRDAFTKIVNDVSNKMKEFGNDAGIYIGKTDDVERRFKEHEKEGELVYCTELATGKPTLIARLEEELIIAFGKDKSLKVLNKKEDSLGNDEADTLYMYVKGYYLKDELGEWTTLHLGDGYPIHIND